MNRQEIIAALEELSKSQGLYGRILSGLNESDEATRVAILSELEAQNFKDTVDLALYLEGIDNGNVRGM